MKLRVLFEISELGSYARMGERGIRRVIENLGSGLMADPAVDVSFTGISRYDRIKVSRVLGEGFELRTRYSPVPRVANTLANLSTRFGASSVASRLRPRRLFPGVFSVGPRFIGELSRRVSPQILARVQIFHSPFAPLPLPSVGPKNLAWFLTIHDIIPLIYPELVSRSSLRDVSVVARSVHRGAWIVCHSESVRIDICERLAVRPERVFVMPLAASTAVFHEASGVEAKTIRQRYGLDGSPYILSLSAIERRKNLVHLVDAFARVARQPKMRDLKLVLVGRYWPDSPEFIALRARHPDLAPRIIFTGFVPNPDLAAIYTGAIAFAFPSLAEGFGLPPLEAMQCGVPVVCSNTTSLPEVVGDAGFLLPPNDVDAWAEALFQLVNDPVLREAMKTKSLARAKLFTWDRTLHELVNAYRFATGLTS